MSIDLHSLDQALNRAKELSANSDKRIIIGIIGKPGAGKSTLSSHLMKNLPKETTALVPMDGYHLSNLQLKKLGRADRKGAPDTFDAPGFVNLLKNFPLFSIFFEKYNKKLLRSYNN